MGLPPTKIEKITQKLCIMAIFLLFLIRISTIDTYKICVVRGYCK